MNEFMKRRFCNVTFDGIGGMVKYAGKYDDGWDDSVGDTVLDGCDEA